MSETTARHGLTLLAPGQAQKEIGHNEALTAIDLLLQPVVEAVGIATPPAAPRPGQCWIVGAAPAGAWAGRAGDVAGWTVGGWRFATAPVGAATWSIADEAEARRTVDGWQIGTVAARRVVVGGRQVVGARAAAIADPVGGGTVDAETRAAVVTILTALRGHGLIAP